MPPECTALVVFGITGDLARKKIFSALYELARLGRLDVAVIGIGRSDWDDRALREAAEKAIRAGQDDGIDEKALRLVLEGLTYIRGDYSAAELYAALDERLGGHRQVLCYLAVPPPVFTEIVTGLGKLDSAERLRLLVEKPFGSDAASAKALLAHIEDRFDRDQVFAVDHYLEKEALQNILVVRFANRMLEPAWNRRHIASVVVTMSESDGIDGRAIARLAVRRCRYESRRRPSHLRHRLAARSGRWPVIEQCNNIRSAQTTQGATR